MNATHTPTAEGSKTKFVSPWANVVAGAIVAIWAFLISGKAEPMPCVILGISGVALALSGFGRMLTTVQEELTTGSQPTLEDVGLESSASRTAEGSP